jgi:hypothetical protein
MVLLQNTCQSQVELMCKLSCFGLRLKEPHQHEPCQPRPSQPAIVTGDAGFVTNGHPGVFPNTARNAQTHMRAEARMCVLRAEPVYFLYDSAGLSFGLAMAFLSESLIGMPTTLPRGGMGLVNHLA